MADLFGANGPGTAVKLNTSSSAAGSISVAGATLPMIITGVGISASVNVQFALSLKDTVYVYVLGDRMGAVTLHGMIFDSLCDGGSGNGLADLMGLYEQQKASAQTEPSTIQISGHAARAFLMSVEGRGDNTLPGVYNVTLSYAALAGGA